jgi:hypothetical protein
MGPTSPSRAASAYRIPGEPPAPAGDADDGGYRDGLHPVLVIVWLASLARVAGAFWTHEAMGGEATLSLAALVAGAWYLCRRAARA